MVDVFGRSSSFTQQSPRGKRGAKGDIEPKGERGKDRKMVAFTHNTFNT